MLRRVTIVAAGALLLFGGWYVGSPWWVLRSMTNAAEARDSDALSKHIDYAAVRSSVRKQLDDRRGRPGSGVLDTLIKSGIAGSLSNLLITPDGMRLVFLAQPRASGSQSAGVDGLRLPDMEMRRQGISRFSMVPRDGKPGALVFHRVGVRWVLREVELP